MSNPGRPAEMSLLEHLVELRSRLIRAVVAVLVGMIVSFAWFENVAFEMALRPLGGRQLLYLGLGEAFATHMLLALYLGVIISLPIVAYQIWAFIAPGLYPTERRAAVGLAFVSTLLFFLGAAFGYFLLLPIIVQFFLRFETEGLRYGGALEPYLKLVAGVIIGTGAAFQLPLVIVGLVKSGAISKETMARQRPYWILAIVTAAAILTPTGDVITQLMLAIPMWVLYEMALVWVKVTTRGKGV